MITIEDRRVLVRDDGHGKASKEPRRFSDFIEADAVVLLGNPGMGKSTLLESRGGADCRPVRKFLLTPRPPAGSALFLDGLDEYRKVGAGLAAPDTLAKALIDLGRPRFRLSCRAADWFGEIDRSVMCEASPTGRVIVLDLLPLDEREIRQLVGDQLDNAEELLGDARRFGLANLLGNPQTLDLLVRAWKSGKRPRNKFEAYHFGIENLLTETKTAHQPRGVGIVRASDLRCAAGAACATLLLANAIAIARTDPQSGEDGVVPLTSVPFEPIATLEHALGRRVFSSFQSDQFEPIHRTVAEFLAAENLARRIRDGLPVERVLALMCGHDGSPVSSLRGLFAWLMCHIGADAEAFVMRDPYALATYGDGACLPPAVQIGVWRSLVNAPDPWFLAMEDEHGAFSGLANESTTPILRAILTDKSASSHLTVACLEAISTCELDLGLDPEIRTHVFAGNDNTWLRKAALRALTRRANASDLEELDRALTSRSDDPCACDLRICLLQMEPRRGEFARRVLSVLEQYKSRGDDSVIGRLFPLRELVAARDLDVLLDAAEALVQENSSSPFELRSLLKDWLIARLQDPIPVDPRRLLKWLRALGRHQSDGDVDRALEARIRSEQGLFDDLLIPAVEEATAPTAWDVVRVLRLDLGRLADNAWPLPPHTYLLDRARRETNAIYAAAFFQESMQRIPKRGYTLEEAEAAHAFIEARPDVAAAAGDWDRYKLHDYEIEQRARQVAARVEAEQTRASNVATLAARLPAIATGQALDALRWAVQHYGDRSRQDDSDDPVARLVALTDQHTTNALIAGFEAFIYGDQLPVIEDIFRAERENSFPTSLILLMLSASMCLRRGRAIPRRAEPAVAAGVIVSADMFVRVAGVREELATWFSDRLVDAQSPAKDMLARAWREVVDRGGTDLPCIYDLTKRPACASVLCVLIPEIFAGAKQPTSNVALPAIRFLIAHDPATALKIGREALTNRETPDALRASWFGVCFAVDETMIDIRQAFAQLAHEGAWGAIDLWQGEALFSPLATLPNNKRAELITAVGSRFHNAGRIGEWCGRHNDYDAAEFVTAHIKNLAASRDADVGALLGALALDPALKSYRDLIRHHLAERARQRREEQFEAPDRDRVASSLSNGAPANAADLLALVVDHLRQTSAEIRSTSFARVHAYWSDKDRRFERLKDEPICSRLLADDLQHRLKRLELAVTVEHHMVREKRCDIVILQGPLRLIPLEVKHHFHAELWTAWHTQLDHLYASDVRSGGMGIYCVLWSGEAEGRRLPRMPAGITRPKTATELQAALTSLIPTDDRYRLHVEVVDISPLEASEGFREQQ